MTKIQKNENVNNYYSDACVSAEKQKLPFGKKIISLAAFTMLNLKQ